MPPRVACAGRARARKPTRREPAATSRPRAPIRSLGATRARSPAATVRTTEPATARARAGRGPRARGAGRRAAQAAPIPCRPPATGRASARRPPPRHAPPLFAVPLAARHVLIPAPRKTIARATTSVLRPPIVAATSLRPVIPASRTAIAQPASYARWSACVVTRPALVDVRAASYRARPECARTFPQVPRRARRRRPPAPRPRVAPAGPAATVTAAALVSNARRVP
jgi:hypothetical protein